MVDFLGLPTDVWAVRELLPTRPLCHLPCYDGMPLVPEVRCFIENGEVVCWHPYWPEGAIREGFPRECENPRSLLDPSVPAVFRSKLPENFEEIVRACHDLDPSEFLPIAQRVADHFRADGAWSVDLLPTDRGWFVTDMALAEESFHWPECALAGKWKRSRP